MSNKIKFFGLIFVLSLSISFISAENVTIQEGNVTSSSVFANVLGIGTANPLTLLDVAGDTDVMGIIGKLKLGYDGSNSDVGVISHYDNMGTTDYALRFEPETTSLNGPQSLALKIAGTTIAYLTNNFFIFQTPIKLEERSTAGSTSAGHGQLWVKDDAPNTLYFQDDLGNNKRIDNALHIETGTYEGDGSTSQQIDLSDSELNIKYINIMLYRSDNSNTAEVSTTDTMILKDPDGFARYSSAATFQMRDNRIIDLSTGSFTVDDNGDDGHPNSNGEEYHYTVYGTY